MDIGAGLPKKTLRTLERLAWSSVRVSASASLLVRYCA
jgi:hypothetical protein